MNKALQNVDDNDLEAAKQLIISCKMEGGRVHLSGVGKSSYIASYIASLLSSTGTPAYMLDTTEAIHGRSGQVLPNDIVVAISNSGETEELKKTVATLKSHGVKILGISSKPDSWLAKNSDVHLCVKVDTEGDALN